MDTTEQIERDLFPVAFCVIATYNDFKDNAIRMLRTLPKNAQVCVLLNGEGEEESLSDIRVDEYEQYSMISRRWTYKKGEFSFSKARNLCHDMTTKDWVFWIDCDELLCEAQHEGIIDAINSFGGGVGGFMAGQASLSTYDQYVSNKTPTYNNIEQCRLYRSNCGFKWEGYAHEQIATSIRSSGYTIIQSTIIIIHNGYAGQREPLFNKLQRNTSLIGRWLYEHDESHSLYSFYRELYARDINGLINMEKTKCQFQDM